MLISRFFHFSSFSDSSGTKFLQTWRCTTRINWSGAFQGPRWYYVSNESDWCNLFIPPQRCPPLFLFCFQYRRSCWTHRLATKTRENKSHMSWSRWRSCSMLMRHLLIIVFIYPVHVCSRCSIFGSEWFDWIVMSLWSWVFLAALVHSKRASD